MMALKEGGGVPLSKMPLHVNVSQSWPQGRDFQVFPNTNFGWQMEIGFERLIYSKGHHKPYIHHTIKMPGRSSKVDERAHFYLKIHWNLASWKGSRMVELTELAIVRWGWFEIGSKGFFTVIFSNLEDKEHIFKTNHIFTIMQGYTSVSGKPISTSIRRNLLQPRSG